MRKSMYAGIDLGTFSIKLTVVDSDNEILFKEEKVHHGDWQNSLFELLAALDPSFSALPVAVTGYFSRELREGGIPAVETIPAIQRAIGLVHPQAASVISIGSQSSLYMTDIKSAVPRFSTNEHCAGGTGSFFEDQMPRLGKSLEDFSSLVEGAKSIPRLSGRCSVFAKTDIIHRQQEGVPLEDIMLGLCYATVRNFKAAIVRGLPVEKPIAFIGGTTRNSGMLRAVKDVFALKDEELLLADDALYIAALGAALEASGSNKTVQDIKEVLKKRAESALSFLRFPPLEEVEEPQEPQRTERMPADGCYLGIDVGSTSTDIVLMDRDEKVIDYLYLRTGGDGIKAVSDGLEVLEKKYGKLNVISSCATGSGRERAGKFFNVDFITDEITCQARAASALVPDCDTVFEIGGQDSKYIMLENGQPVSFRMNRICAAGTGSFVEEIARRLEIALNDFADQALRGKAPVDLGERCTVFMSSAVSLALCQGLDKSDIAAGVCYSIVRNYLHKVVGEEVKGKKIVFQGGLGYNRAILSAFRAITGREVCLSPLFSISGAYGAALKAKDSIRRKVFDEAEQRSALDFYMKPAKLLVEDYDGQIRPGRKTVGIPYSLMIHRFFPMANAFFSTLGFNVILSDPTNEDTIRGAQESAEAETCYPVKLIYGHMKQLVDKGVDYIFMPSIRTLKHENSTAVHSFGCVYMQMAPSMIASSLKIEEKGIKLINPVFDLDMGKEAMAMGMMGAAKALGIAKPLALPAMMKGAAAIMKHTKGVMAEGKRFFASLGEDEKVLVIVTRNYGVYDNVLNMGLPQLLIERGYRVMPLSYLEAQGEDFSDEYPTFFWPFSEHIISGAKTIRKNKKLFAVYLTNHGCGPDSMIRRIFAHEMKGKPYLEIEVDEHYSKVGITTRVDAFLQSLENWKEHEVFPDKIEPPAFSLRHTDRPLVIPPLGPYSRYLARYYSSVYSVETELAQVGESTAEKGRAETGAKEYSEFSLLLGLVRERLEKDSHFQILIPSGEGAEAEAVYPDVINTILRDSGDGPVEIFSPVLESLPEKEKDPSLFARAILAGDLDLASWPAVHQWSGIPTFEELEEAAKELSNKEKDGNREVEVTGSPISIFASEAFIRPLVASMGFSLRIAPLGEYLSFLSADTGYSNRILEEEREKLDRLMGQSSIYRKYSELKAAADGILSPFSGANARYRAARAVLSSASEVISVSPRYENTETILQMKHAEGTVPLFRFASGENDEEDASRLRAFLHYLK